MAKQKKGGNKKKYNALLEKKRKKQRETKILNKERLQAIIRLKNEQSDTLD